MPFEPSKLNLNVSTRSAELPVPAPDADYIDLLDEGFAIDSGFYAAYKQLRDTELNKVDPSSRFDGAAKALQDGLDIEAAERFSLADSPEEYAIFKRQYEDELEDKVALDQGGIEGFFARMTGAIASPSSFISGVGAVKLLTSSTSALKTGSIIGGVSGAAIGVEEKLLQDSQFTRSDEEVLINTIAGTMFAGALGAGGQALKNSIAGGAADQLASNLKEFADVAKGKFGTKLGEMVETETSVGARLAALSKEELGIADPQGFLGNLRRAVGVGVTKPFSPAVRMMESASRKMRETFQKLAETSVITRAEQAGKSTGVGLETKLALRYQDFTGFIDNTNKSYKLFAKETKGTDAFLDRVQFRREIGKAVSLGSHPNKIINDQAKIWRDFYRNYLEELVDVKLLPEDMLAKTEVEQINYLNRMYATEKIRADRNGFKDAIMPWLRAEAKKVKADFDARIMEIERIKKEGNTGANKKIQELKLNSDELSAYRRKFESDEALEEYLNQSANSIIDNITGAKNVAGFKPVRAGAAGPLKERSFNIPDEMIVDWIETDIYKVADNYQRRVGPAIEFKRTFGDESFEDIRDEIIREYADEMDLNPTKSKKLARERDEVLRDFDTTWQLLNGTYKGLIDDPYDLVKRGSMLIRSVNYVTMLGGVVVSSLGDVVLGPLRQGFKTFFGKSLKPFIKGVTASGKNMSRVQAKSWGQGINTVSATRMQGLANIGDPMNFGTPLENFTAHAGNVASNVFLINQWNDLMQAIHTGGVTHRIFNNIADFTAGKKLVQKEAQHMAFLGIDEATMRRVGKMLDEFGEIDELNDGAVIPNADRWTDRQAADTIRAAITKEVNRTLISKGVTDIPRFFNNEIGQLMGQFQNFTFAFHNKVILSGLIDGDKSYLINLGWLAGMGMMVQALKDISNGQPLPDDPEEWIYAGLDRSGLLGIIGFGNNFTEAFLGINTNKLVDDDAYTSFGASSVLKALLGPSGSTIVKGTRLAGSLMPNALTTSNTSGFTQSDLHTLRTLTPFQNAIGIKYLFDYAEEGLSEFLPEKRSQQE